eukprot:TRINITY_DN1132_c2_g1_i2.p1 TRINITY_DN1132_c2_g1~~TRINITY_DN1132_c2_g1_i2.p1  ORF type:complete len:836 (+),score=147.47 TRINITY_DN1132_c2_g1_i2:79-2586(+)
MLRLSIASLLFWSSSAAPCDCLSSWSLYGETYAGCQTTRSSPSQGWCMVEDPASCNEVYSDTDVTTGGTYYYKLCWDNLDTSKPCECLASWTDVNATSWDQNAASTCGNTQSGCPTTSCNNMHTYYASTYGYSSWCVVGNAACDSAQLNSNGYAYMVCEPDEIADACSCQGTWTYNNVQYSGCQTTPDSPSAAWCMVDWTCKSANGKLFGTDPSTYASFPYKYCTDGIEQNKVCSCGSNACNNLETPYCVASNAGCDTTPAGSNSANNEAYITCSPTECDCLDSWVYQSVTYNKCQTTPDSPSQPWCLVSETCKSAFAKNDTLGITSSWKYCTDLVDWTKTCECGSNPCQNTATPYCEITNAPCDKSPYPSNTAGKAYATCTPTDCSCLASWTWNSVNYAGCQATPDSLGATWCAVNGQTCASATTATDSTSATISYVNCVSDTACDCYSSWTHPITGITYNGCQTTPNSPSAPWCYVDGNCPSATADGNGYYYKTCDDNLGTEECSCGSNACINADVPYCIITNAPCNKSPVGNNGDSNNAYASCTPAECNCKSSWTWGGNTYSDCSTTPDGAGQTWCVVENAACTSKTEIQDPVSGAGVQTIYCTSSASCYCLNPFDYNGATYSGCSTSMDSPSVPWCKVLPGCSWAQWSKDSQNADYSWSLCTDGVDANTDCECADTCVDNGSGVQVCKSKAACKEATGSGQYIKCTSASTPVTLSPNAPPGTTLSPATLTPGTTASPGTTPAPIGNAAQDDGSDGLSTGIIVLIVLGSIFLVLAVVGGVFYWKKQNERASFWNAGEQEMANDLANVGPEAYSDLPTFKDVHQAQNPTVNRI